jgi:CheY-like chemotaxis protein
VRIGFPVQNNPQVLVVDDDTAIREILVQLTRDTVPEAQISAVHNGREALADLKLHGADLVITNFSMPVMDGPELVRELRAREFAAPVIMVSSNPDAQAQGEAAGINRFVAKTEVFASLPGAILSLLEAA